MSDTTCSHVCESVEVGHDSGLCGCRCCAEEPDLRARLAAVERERDVAESHVARLLLRAEAAERERDEWKARRDGAMSTIEGLRLDIASLKRDNENLARENAGRLAGWDERWMRVQSELQDADQRASRLEEALRAIEWCHESDPLGEWCPACGGRQEDGHKGICSTRAALAGEKTK